MRAARAQLIQQRPQRQDVVAAPDEGQRKEVAARLHSDANVALVLLGQRRQVDVDAREVDMPPRTEPPRRGDAAAQGRVVLLDDFHANEPAVDEHRRADRDVPRKTGVVDVDPAKTGRRALGVQLERVALLEIDRIGDHARADFGTLDVHHDGDVPLDADRDVANPLHQRGHPLAGAVSHVQAHHVDAGDDQLLEHLRALGRRADGGDDLGVPVIAAHA